MLLFGEEIIIVIKNSHKMAFIDVIIAKDLVYVVRLMNVISIWLSVNVHTQ